MEKMQKPILLDGSMGQELANRGAKTQYGLWAVAALYEHPTMVQTVHEDYIRAGAEVITTNTYATTRTRLRHVGQEDRLAELVRIAGTLAIQAREKTQAKHVKIAASLPPLEGSYISNFKLDFDSMVAEYRELMDLLEPSVNIYLAETLSTSQEARAVLTAAQDKNKPVWISWTLQDHGSSTLRGGESIQQAIDSIRDFSVDAILINCCTPDSIEAALPTLQASNMPFGAYANGFVEIPTDWAYLDSVKQLESRTDLSPKHYAQQAKKWLHAGASIIGGCCEVAPQHIAKLHAIIDDIV
ncbi:MAG: homocysteine S-methyltransferase family protein [Anaerolineae bacterium]|nr:homocysteine S-methyltransferase family protein [Anaerolineae bacterium]